MSVLSEKNEFGHSYRYARAEKHGDRYIHYRPIKKNNMDASACGLLWPSFDRCVSNEKDFLSLSRNNDVDVCKVCLETFTGAIKLANYLEII